MFAGAIVVNLQRPAAMPHEIVLGFRKIGPVGAAFVMGLIFSCLLQHGAGHAHMIRLAIVGGTGQRNFLIGEAKAISRT
jgi:hypothetical protein